ncbi:MAG: NAD(P)/FAD-dependent oxidoreductase [Pseudomonadota bacterium]
MTSDIETIVVGAGVVGLAAASALAHRGQHVLVLERNRRVGAETSSRNSEVVHAGLYYPPGSLRAKLCVEGKARLYSFATENAVAVNRCGKLLVATADDEIARLDAIAATAAANGVDDLARLSPAEARALEPEIVCVAAILSPSTGVIDSHGLMAALEGHVTSRGGEVVLSTAVERIARRDDGAFVLDVVSGGVPATISARRLVLAAGLGGSVLGRTLQYRDGYIVPATYPAKGHYFTLTGRAPFRHLVYPVPSGAWLGVHLTLDVAGQAKFGPDIDWVETIDYAFDDRDGCRRATFEREIRRWWPGLPDDALAPGYTGIRPKLYRPGEQVQDFAIHSTEQHGVAGLVALYGIESPGLTASLAIGEHVARLLEP